MNIVLYTQGLEFDGSTLDKQALGGSESAFTYLAREFPKMGFNVTAFTKCPAPGLYEGVLYKDVSEFEDFLTRGECDLFICSRFFQVFSHPIPAKVKILWNHDILVTPEQLMGVAYGVDYMYCLSDFHKSQYCGLLPELSKIIKLTTNGVDQPIIRHSNIKKHQIMFTSRPERGLLKALEFFERLGDKSLKFLICNYSTIHDPRVEQIEAHCSDYASKLIQDGFNIEFNQFTKPDLMKNISESKCVIYPTDFPEISCISAMEAQASATCFLTYKKFALAETVTPNTLAETEEDLFELFKKTVTDEGFRQINEKAGFLHSQKHRWHYVASQFANDARDFLKHKGKNKKGIFDRLIYNSDILAAKYFAEKRYSKGKKVVESLLAHTASSEAYKCYYDDCTNGFGKDLQPSPFYDLAAQRFKSAGCKKILDFGCNTGFGTTQLFEANQNAEVVGYDISEKCIKFAGEKYKDKRIKFINEKPSEKFDAVYAGEILEHVLNPTDFINEIESLVNDGGKVFFTVPRGAWEWLSRHERQKNNNHFEHLSGFDIHDLMDLFGKKSNLMINSSVERGLKGAFGERLGHYAIEYIKTEAETGKIDYERKISLTRPYPSLSACIIAKNAEKDIEHCLESIYQVVDDIVVIDDKSSDETVNRAKKFTDKVFVAEKTICEPDFKGFAVARNESVSHADGEWILWIDTDERLILNDYIRRYLESDLLNAYVIKQHHAQLDSFVEADKPQRLYRRTAGKFVGYIHEQAMDINDINKPITPSLILDSIKIIHFGAISESTRRDKALSRNLNLLAIDAKMNPNRLLTWVLIMRDFVNRIKWSFEHFGTYINPDSYNTLNIIRDIWNKRFKNLENDTHRDLAFANLQDAMVLTEAGVELKYSIAVNKPNTFKNQVPELRTIRVFEDEIQEFFQKLQTAVSHVAGDITKKGA